ncbi:MAG: glycoside hydrolase family 5 protein [Acidobacteriota bacterium]
MPALPITDKDTAWGHWKAGLLAAANVGLSLNASNVTPTVHNLAIRKGYNALRLQLGAAGPYTLCADDLSVIAAQGWDDTGLTVGSRSSGAPLTYKQVAAQIDRILSLAQGVGAGVIMAVTDFHQERGGSLWQQAALQDALVGFWTATARRWPASAFPQLVGYDLLNAPYPDPTRSFAELNAVAPNPPTLHNWRALANRCVAAIRAQDSKTPIVVQGVYGGAARGLDIFRNLADAADRSLLIQDPAARVVYAFNLYAPLPFTHQGVNSGAYEALGTLYGDSAYAHWRVRDYYNADPAGGRAAANLSQDFTSYLSLISHFRNDAYYLNAGRSNPQADFHTQFGVPIFVSEFSAVNPRLSKASLVEPRDSHRMLTAVNVTANRVTLTLGNLDSNGFRVDCGPNPAAWPFSNQILLVVSDTGTPLDGIAFTTAVTAGQKVICFTSSWTLPDLNLGPKGTDAINNAVGTLTLALSPAKQTALELARQRYTRDALRMCKQLGFSWAWHFEDNELSGEFNGWRPSQGVASILSAAAAGLTLN